MAKDILNTQYLGSANIEKVSRFKAIKHPILIKGYAKVRKAGKLVSNFKKHFVGLDIETNNETNEIMLMGIADRNPLNGKAGYDYFYRGEIGVRGLVHELVRLVDYCGDREKNGGARKNIVWWSEFDPYQIINLLFDFGNFTREERENAMRRYKKKIDGYYKKPKGEKGRWFVPPLIEITLEDGTTFGISKALDTCLCFFYFPKHLQNKENGRPIEIWALDGEKFWNGALFETAKTNLDWITKSVEKICKQKETHVVNWNLFEEQFIGGMTGIKGMNKQGKYCQAVLCSNYADARNVLELTEKIQDMFFELHGFYPASLFTAGSLATASMGAILPMEERAELNWYVQMENWKANDMDADTRKLMYDLAIDSYSAGIIEVVTQGYCERVGFVDITNAYASILNALPNLYNSILYKGFNCSWEDVPQPDNRNLVFVTCLVDIPERLGSWHTLSMKLAAFEKQNQTEDEKNERHNTRLQGQMVISGLYEEFLFLQKQARRNEEIVLEVKEWVRVECKGDPTPYRKVVQKLWKDRKAMIEETKRTGKKNELESLIKTIMASLYGKTFECLEQYDPNFITEIGYDGEEETQEEIVFNGRRAGEFFNPIIASIVTAFTRLRLMEMAVKIKQNGGKIMVLMTDAIYFQIPEGKDATDIVPKSFESILNNYEGLELNGYTEEKTLGMFDAPKEYTDAIFLKPGFYEFYNPGLKLEDGTLGGYELKVMGNFIRRDDEKKKHPTLKEKMQLAIDRPGLFTDEFDYEYIVIGKEDDNRVVISPGTLIEESEHGQKTDFTQLGKIVYKENKISFHDLYPKRMHKDPRQYSFTTLLNGTLETVPMDASMFMEEKEGFNLPGFIEPLDGRLMECRQLHILRDPQEEEKPAKKVKVAKPKQDRLPRTEQDKKDQKALSKKSDAQRRKELAKQINDFIMPFGQKEKSFGGNNAKDWGIPKMRAFIEEKGFTPVA